MVEMYFSEIIYLSEKRKLLEVRFQFRSNKSMDYGLAEVYEIGSLACYSRKRIGFYKPQVRSRKLAKFSLSVDHDKQLVVFGPVGELGMVPFDLRGAGIGRFCVSRLVDELAFKFDGYAVHSGKLSFVDASDESSKNNRNNFYIKLGFTLELDETSSFGRFHCSDTKKLVRKWNRKKVRRIKPESVAFFLSKYATLNNNFVDLKDNNMRSRSEIGSLNSALNRKNKVIFWLLIACVFEAALLAIVL